MVFLKNHLASDPMVARWRSLGPLRAISRPRTRATSTFTWSRTLSMTPAGPLTPDPGAVGSWARCGEWSAWRATLRWRRHIRGAGASWRRTPGGSKARKNFLQYIAHTIPPLISHNARFSRNALEKLHTSHAMAFSGLLKCHSRQLILCSSLIWPIVQTSFFLFRRGDPVPWH